MEQKKIAEKITEIRKSKGLTVAKFSKLLGNSHTAVDKLEAGKSLPGCKTLKKLWLIFGHAPNELVHLVEIKNTKDEKQREEIL